MARNIGYKTLGGSIARSKPLAKSNRSSGSRPRRYRPGEKALKEIRFYQRNTELLLKKNYHFLD